MRAHLKAYHVKGMLYSPNRNTVYAHYLKVYYKTLKKLKIMLKNNIRLLYV
jgi:hypothetical protein